MIQVLTGAAAVMDGSVSRSFVLQLTENMAVTPIKLAPGGKYSVQVEQDSVGGHAVTWTQNIRNAPAVNPLPNGKTNMVFLALDNGVGYLAMTGTIQ